MRYFFFKKVIPYLYSLLIKLFNFLIFGCFIYFIKYWIKRWDFFFFHFYYEFNIFFKKCRKFVKKRFNNWVKWNFYERWTLFRLFFFLFTTLSLIKPVYFCCRWLGYLNYFFWSVLFILWRAFFFELFTYLFDWVLWSPSIKLDPCFNIRHLMLLKYRKHRRFWNKFCFFFTSCFYLCYIDYFFAYLDSLRYRNWEQWLLSRADLVNNIFDYIFDDVIIMLFEIYEWYDWYKIELIFLIRDVRRDTRRIIARNINGFVRAIYMYIAYKKYHLNKRLLILKLKLTYKYNKSIRRQNIFIKNSYIKYNLSQQKSKKIYNKFFFYLTKIFPYKLKYFFILKIPFYSIYSWHWLKNHFLYYSACFFYFFWQIFIWVLKWFKMRTWLFVQRNFNFRFFTKYGRHLILYQIEIYWVLLRSILEVILAHLGIIIYYYYLKLRYIFGYYLYSWIVIIVFFFLGIICVIIDFSIAFWHWLKCTKLFNFFWNILDNFIFFFKKLCAKIFQILRFFKKFFRYILLFLKKLPFFSRLLKYYDPIEKEKLDDHLIREYLYLILLFWRKHTYKIPEDVFKNTYIEIKKESLKDAYISQYLLLIKERWESEGEIPEDEYANLLMIKEELERDELLRLKKLALIRDFQPKKNLKKWRDNNRKNQEKREKLVTTLKDYLKNK